ncbi:MAG: acyltransferase [Elusimicrobia bacterium]|nr:acyltransferase [Elusimicrobiota bacterium]
MTNLTQAIPVNNFHPSITQRLLSLDFLRGIAILLVLGRHIIVIPSHLPFPIMLFLKTWAKIGWVGVDLFFVLSGFLVSGLLFSEYKITGRVNVFSFFTRRGIKIYPSFWVFLFISFLVTSAVSPSMWRGGKHTIIELLFLQNYLPGQWDHTWSLAVEEHFYLLLGLLIFLLSRAKNRFINLSWFIPITVVLCFSLLFARGIKTCILSGLPDRLYMKTHFRIDGLFFGALMSYFYHFKFGSMERLVKKHHRYLWVMVLFLLSPPFYGRIENGRFVNSIGFTLIYVGFGLLLAIFLFPLEEKMKFKSLGARIVCGIGRDSYLTYLYHFPIYYWTLYLFMKAKLNTQAYFYFHLLLYIGASLLIGRILATLFERPMLKWRDKWFPSPLHRRFETGS